MTLLALTAASWILVSLVATTLLCLLATALKAGTPAIDAPGAAVLALPVGARAAASVVSLPAQRRSLEPPVTGAAPRPVLRGSGATASAV